MLSNRVFVFHLVNKSHRSLLCLNREEDDEGDEVEFTTKLGNLQSHGQHLMLKYTLMYLLTKQDCV